MVLVQTKQWGPFPTLSALNNPPTATGGSVPRSAHPPPHSPLKPQRPRHFDAARSVSHSVAPARPRFPSRTVPNTVRVTSTLNRRRSSRCGLPCGAVCGAVPLGRRSRRPPIQLPPRPSAVAVAVAVVADAVPVPVPVVAEAAGVLLEDAVLDRGRRLPTAPSKSSVESRPASPQPNLAHLLSPSRSSLLSVSQKPPLPSPLADAVAAGPRPVLSPSPLPSRSPSLPHTRDTPPAR